MTISLTWRAAIVSLALFAAFILAWHLATRGTGQVAQMSPEYAKLMGLTATQGKSAMPGPLDVGAKLWDHVRRPFYDNGPNDKGVGIQLAYSIARVAAGRSPARMAAPAASSCPSSAASVAAFTGSPPRAPPTRGAPPRPCCARRCAARGARKGAWSRTEARRRASARRPARRDTRRWSS